MVCGVAFSLTIQVRNLLEPTMIIVYKKILKAQK